ncbi:MAG: hypothetical protein ACRDIB_19130, partial [Ardenticatenaceae bacterium]
VELDRLAAERGGRLLGRVLDELQEGRSVPREQPAGGSYHSWPRPEDFIVPTSWSARHAWNFMWGTAEWGVPFTIPLPTGDLVVGTPLRVAPAATQDVPILYSEEAIAIRFTPGVLLFAKV